MREISSSLTGSGRDTQRGASLSCTMMRGCCWCFSHVQMRLSPALTPPLDLCNYADEVLYTFAYLSLHQTLAFSSSWGKGKFLCASSSSHGRQTWWGRNFESFPRAPLALRALLGNRIATKNKINPWSFLTQSRDTINCSRTRVFNSAKKAGIWL